MASLSYDQNKTYVLKWREKNPDKVREYVRRSMQKSRLRARTWAEIKIEFLNILVE